MKQTDSTPGLDCSDLTFEQVSRIIAWYKNSVEQITAAHEKATQERVREAERNAFLAATTWVTNNTEADKKWHEMLTEAAEESNRVEGDSNE